MSRKGSIIISESIEQLDACEKSLSGRQEARQVRALALLRSGLTQARSAELVGVSLSTLKRWVKLYQAGGLRALIGWTISPELAILREKIAGRELGDLSEVRGWIEGRCQASRLSGETSDGEADYDPGPESVMKFIRSLSYGGDIPISAATVKKGIQSMFPEIDHVSLSINTICCLWEMSAPKYIAVSQLLSNPSATFRMGNEVSHAERVMQTLRRSKLPFHEYGAPYEMTIMARGFIYLGVMFLWRKKNRPSFPDKLLRAMETMRPLFQMIYVQWVASYQLNNSVALAFETASLRFCSSVDLSVQERRIMMLLITGESYRSISRMLNISINTVRSHVRSIYDKAGVRNCPALVTKFFALDGGGPPEEGRPSAARQLDDRGEDRRSDANVDRIRHDAEAMSFMIG